MLSGVAFCSFVIPLLGILDSTRINSCSGVRFAVGLFDLRLRLPGIENWASIVGLVGLFDLLLKFRLSGVENCPPKFGLVGLVDLRLPGHLREVHDLISSL